MRNPAAASLLSSQLRSLLLSCPYPCPSRAAALKACLCQPIVGSEGIVRVHIAIAGPLLRLAIGGTGRADRARWETE